MNALTLKLGNPAEKARSEGGMRIPRGRFTGIVAVVATLIMASGANAAPLYSVTVSGTVSSVEAPLGVEFVVGEAFTFSYTFDFDTPDTQAPTDTAFYQSAINSASLNIGDYPLTAVGLGNIVVRDDAFGSDQYGVLIEDPIFASTRPGAVHQGGSVAGLVPFAIVVTLRDNDSSVFASDALPTMLPLLSLFEVKEFELGFAGSLEPGRAFDTARVYGAINNITVSAVPLPATLPLFAGGLGLLSLIGWRRKRMAAA